MFYVSCEGYGPVRYFCLSSSDPEIVDMKTGGDPICFDDIQDCLRFLDLLQNLYPDEGFRVCKSSGSPDDK